MFRKLKVAKYSGAYHGWTGLRFMQGQCSIWLHNPYSISSDVRRTVGTVAVSEALDIDLRFGSGSRLKDRVQLRKKRSMVAKYRTICSYGRMDTKRNPKACHKQEAHVKSGLVSIERKQLRSLPFAIWLIEKLETMNLREKIWCCPIFCWSTEKYLKNIKIITLIEDE